MPDHINGDLDVLHRPAQHLHQLSGLAEFQHLEVVRDDLPQLRLNAQYKRMLDRNQEPSKDVRNYVKERYASAIQLMKNIEQRKQTILKD